MRLPTITIATAALCGISSIASAQDIYVSATANPLIANGSQGAPFLSIHNAVQAATAGATIWVGPGTYNQFGIVLPRNVVIRGAGKDETILDANNLGRAFYLETQKIAEISGMTITNGTSPLGTDGGAIYCHYSSALWLKDVRLSNNTAGAEGGAVAMFGTNLNPEMILQRCEFVNNRANAGEGGAVKLVEGSARILVTNCLFDGNSASIDSPGIYVWTNGPMTVVNCTFVNHSLTPIGGIELVRSGWGSMNFTNVILADNTAGRLRGSSFQSAVIRDSLLQMQPVHFTIGSGARFEDAVFVDAAAGNYRLPYGAPGFDQGDPSPPSFPPTVDLDQRPRIRFQTMDMGAYETSDGAFDSIGSGCPGTNGLVSQLAVANGMPSKEGATFELTDIGTAPFAWVALGQSPFSAPNGINLGAIGAPACSVFFPTLALEPVAISGGTGQTNYIPFGGSSSLLQSSLYAQAVVIDVGANPSGFVFSDGYRAILGY